MKYFHTNGWISIKRWEPYNKPVKNVQYIHVYNLSCPSHIKPRSSALLLISQLSIFAKCFSVILLCWVFPLLYPSLSFPVLSSLFSLFLSYCFLLCLPDRVIALFRRVNTPQILSLLICSTLINMHTHIASPSLSQMVLHSTAHTFYFITQLFSRLTWCWEKRRGRGGRKGRVVGGRCEGVWRGRLKEREQREIYVCLKLNKCLCVSRKREIKSTKL